MRTLSKYNARLSFTCVEMRDCEHPPEGRCSPQGLLQQVQPGARAMDWGWLVGILHTRAQRPLCAMSQSLLLAALLLCCKQWRQPACLYARLG
jgi:hypothetical protein